MNITLNVENGASTDSATGSATDGAKVNVNENHVTFGNGDKILVVSNGHYVGTLTHDGSNFSGSITDPTVGQPLYFYFLGNKTPEWATSGDDKVGCIVNISDQTSELPVISMGVSIDKSHGNVTVNYQTGKADYEAQLHNRCALVKFSTNVNSGMVSVTGMNTVATVDFGTGSITSGTSGTVSFNTDGSGIGWVILLPQGEVSTATANAGFGPSAAFTVPEITANMYDDTGVDAADMPLTKTFNYTGAVQTFTVPATGYYTLQCYGAQGGSFTSTRGGYGGTAQLTYLLTRGDVLYLYVGGQGGSMADYSGHPEGADGGWNGGGKGGTGVSWHNSGTPYSGGGGGGGATHIATSAIGVITGSTSFTTNHANLLLVAGGGGGGAAKGQGGNAGGATGEVGSHNGIFWGIDWNNGTYSCGENAMLSSNGSSSCEGCGGGGAGYQGGNTWDVQYNLDDQCYSGAGGSSWGETINGKDYSTTTGGATSGGNGKAIITWYGAIYPSK